MKKIGLLLLVLVLALGTIGVGYAKWTTTVTVTGTVNTGNVQVGIRDVGTSDPGPNGVDGKVFPASAAEGTYDPRVNPLAPFTAAGLPNFVTDNPKNVGAADSTNGTAKCVCTGVQYFGSVTETVTNAYPFYAPTLNLEIANCGTIPVKVETVTVTAGPTENVTGLLDCIRYAWSIQPPACTACVPPTVAPNPVNGYGTFEQFRTALENGHFQIDSCGVLTIALTEVFLECTPQDASGSWTITVTASQYNEVFEVAD